MSTVSRDNGDGAAAAAAFVSEGEILAEMLMPTQQQEAQVRAIVEAKKDNSTKQGWRTGRWSEEVSK